MKMFKMLLFVGPLLFSIVAFAEQPKSIKLYNTKIDSSVKNCPKSELSIAKEILELELLGMRYQRSKPSCFENMTAKYVHVQKNPDESTENLVATVGESEDISVEYNKKFFSYKVTFSVQNLAGKKIKGAFSFMRTAKAGAKKPKRGCARITVSPAVAFVKSSCL